MKIVNFFAYILGERSCDSVTDITMLERKRTFRVPNWCIHMTQRITAFHIELKICQFHDTTNLFDLSSVLGACYI